MDAIDLVRRLHQHRAWVNANLLAAAAQLGEAPLHLPFPIGQGSIWRSLLHLHAAEYVWLEALQGNDQAVFPGDLPGKLPGNQNGPGEDRIKSLDELWEKWSALERRWTAYLAPLRPETLEEVVYRSSVALGKRLGTRRGDVLLHVCMHAHYTTAQIVNMFRQAGASKLPEVMLVSLARLEAV